MADLIWAMEQLLGGRKVRQAWWDKSQYWHLHDNRLQWGVGFCVELPLSGPFRTDWELYDDRPQLTCTADAITAVFAGHKVRRAGWPSGEFMTGEFVTRIDGGNIIHRGRRFPYSQVITPEMWEATDWEYV